MVPSNVPANNYLLKVKYVKVNNNYSGTRKVNDKVNNKDTVDVFLVFVLLTLNIIHFLL